MRERLGGEANAFFEALLSPPDGLRMNTLRGPSEALKAVLPFEVEAISGISEGFVIESDVAAGKHPLHAAGLYYLQDPSAMWVGVLADVRPGELVLDLAAAPGGKSTHLAARMENRGLLVANDVSASRARELVGNFERCGVRNGVVVSATVDQLADRFGPIFDRVIVDAPCSGESMFSKSEAARSDWSLTAVEGCGRRQREVVDRAVDLLHPGGLLVYSTCTFATEENEDVIDGLIRSHGLVPAELPTLEGAEGVRGGTGEVYGYRFWPHRSPGAGHFVACLRKVESSDVIRFPEEKEARPDGTSIDLLRAFLEEALSGFEIEESRIRQHRENLYLLPDEMIALDGLRVLRAGLALGEVRKGRFEPAHALALATSPDLAIERVDLPVDDERVGKYLRGETIREPGRSGWIVVSVEGFALGWGKRTADVVKNHYPKGLRRRGEG